MLETVIVKFWVTERSLVFVASDGEFSVNDTVLVTVNPVNDAPVLSAIPTVFFAEDTFNDSLDLNGLVLDVDNLDSEINWTATGQVNVVVAINNATKAINFTAVGNFSGSENVTLTAQDVSGLTDSKNLTVTVTSVNDVPFFNSSNPVLNVTFN